MFIKPSSKKERAELLDFLEKEGFYYWPDRNSREETEGSRYPITINLRCKRISHIGNETCAAASISLHKSVEWFYELYKKEKHKYYSPVVIHVPHASTVIPDEERKYFTTEDLEGEIIRMTDHYCDDLFECSHEMLAFQYIRLVCDVERFADDGKEPMAARGMGFAYTHGSNLQEIRRLSAEHRSCIGWYYYERHHDEFDGMVRRRLIDHGKCLIIDVHSFPGMPLPYEMDDRLDRPDICIGTDDFHTDKELSSITKDYFEDKGYRVELNYPFSDSIVPMRYYRKDPRVQSIMIEINRNLYMDSEANIIEGYKRIKAGIREYLDGLESWLMG